MRANSSSDEPNANSHIQSDSDETSEYARFTQFLGQLVAVPHSAIKSQLDKEKKKRQKAKLRHASRASGASSKAAN